MKAIKTRPFKRLLLVVLSLTTLAGCSGVQKNTLYQTWEQRAYSAYKLKAPSHQIGVLPALFRSVAPGRQQAMPQRTSAPNIAAVAAAAIPAALPVADVYRAPQQAKPVVLPDKEQQYIANYYGL